MVEGRRSRRAQKWSPCATCKIKETFAPFHADPTRGMRSVFIGRPTEVDVRINRRAYEFYVARGREAGHDVDDWLQAEREILWD
jgi:hypothetical protein